MDQNLEKIIIHMIKEEMSNYDGDSSTINEAGIFNSILKKIGMDVDSRSKRKEKSSEESAFREQMDELVKKAILFQKKYDFE